MDPKSSDGETKEGFSSEPQPMETITGASSLLGKRKAETADIEDSDEGKGVEVEGDDNDEYSDEDSDFGWDKDSFEGREYNPADNSDYSDNEDTQERVRFYNRTCIDTKGFFEPSNKFPRYCTAGIVPVAEDPENEVYKGITVREFLGNMAAKCVEKYNKRKKMNVKFDHFVRANFYPGSKTRYYITFAATESDSPTLVEYQAKVVWRAGKTCPILCRPSPPKKVEGDGVGQSKS